MSNTNSAVEHYGRIGIAIATAAAGLAFVVLGILNRDQYYIGAGVALGTTSGLTAWSTNAPLPTPPAPPAAG